MAIYGYSTKLNGEHVARASGRDLGISTKTSIEICRWLRYRNLQKAKNLLEKVIIKKVAVPYLRFNTKMGHKPGITSGGYPISAAKEILRLLNSVEKNAQSKSLNIETLKIIHMNAHKASTPVHAGRHGGRVMKRTHVEILVAEEKPAKGAANKKVKTEKLADKAKSKKETSKIERVENIEKTKSGEITE
ncbi:50S ribosomal protein L22 [Candidatus Woesearchaeota archaeon]|nr:50S ribosomal protein L22 [Candidatus Woesearchaeota archaeon]